jgi:hypothetical protein
MNNSVDIMNVLILTLCSIGLIFIFAVLLLFLQGISINGLWEKKVNKKDADRFFENWDK